MNVKPKRTQVTTHDMAGDLFIQYISKKNPQNWKPLNWTWSHIYRSDGNILADATEITSISHQFDTITDHRALQICQYLGARRVVNFLVLRILWDEIVTASAIFMDIVLSLRTNFFSGHDDMNEYEWEFTETINLSHFCFGRKEQPLATRIKYIINMFGDWIFSSVERIAWSHSLSYAFHFALIFTCRPMGCDGHRVTKWPSKMITKSFIDKLPNVSLNVRRWCWRRTHARTALRNYLHARIRIDLAFFVESIWNLRTNCSGSRRELPCIDRVWLFYFHKYHWFSHCLDERKTL